VAVSNRKRFEVLRRDNHACRYCGAKAPFVELHVDHVIPRSRGGCDEAWNLTAACVRCNMAKGDGIPAEFIVREVREDEATYQVSKGLPVVACMWCSKPIQQLPDEDQVSDCETCNAAVCTAWEAGRRGR
jgi:hypothetical protein